jgi:putative peptidoglycan lipid II flippase
VETAPPDQITPSLPRAGALMTAGTIVSRLTGVVRLAVLAATLGVVETRFTDTYNLANTAPNILYELVLGGVIASVFVPVFVELLENNDRDKAWRSISAIFNVSLLVLTGLAIIGVVAAPLLANFYASRLVGDELARQQDVLVFLMRLFIPQVVLYGIYFMGSGVLNAHRKFVLPMFTPILNNLVLIAVLILFSKWHDLVTLDSVTTSQLLLLGLGTTASVAPMGLLLLPVFLRLGKYTFTLRIEPELRRRIFQLSVFVFGFVASNQVAYLVMQWLANEQQGGYTAFLMANAFFLLPIGLFVWTISTAVLPRLTREALAESWESFGKTLSSASNAVNFLMIPSAVVLFVLAEPLVNVLLRHGVVTGRSTDLIADVLRFLVLGLVQFSLFQIYIRAFYALQDAKTPFLVNVVVVVLNMAVNLPMFAWLGVEGLAAGQGLAYSAGLVIQLRLLRERIGHLGLYSMLVSGSRLVVASAAMAAVLYVSLQLVRDLTSSGAVSDLVQVVVPLALGAATYLGAAILLRVEEIDYLKRAVFRPR